MTQLRGQYNHWFRPNPICTVGGLRFRGSRRATAHQEGGAAWALLPILASVPLMSRAILRRCMIHSSTVSAAKSRAALRSPLHNRSAGVAALATRPESDE